MNGLPQKAVNSILITMDGLPQKARIGQGGGSRQKVSIVKLPVREMNGQQAVLRHPVREMEGLPQHAVNTILCTMNGLPQKARIAQLKHIAGKTSSSAQVSVRVNIVL